MPRYYGVAAIGNVFDFVIAALVGLGKIRSRTDNEISLHIRVYVAEQRNDAWLVEGKGSLFTLRPSTEIMSGFLVTANRRPEDVVLHIVAIQEINGCALLHDHEVWDKHQAFLIRYRMFFGSGKGFAGDGVDVNHRRTLAPSNFSRDVARRSRGAQSGDQNCEEECFIHCVFSPLV